MEIDSKTEQGIEAFIGQSPELDEARKNGVDLWALWHNLQRTPAQRLARHQIALDRVRTLRKAKKL
jgi:hypothetical protein